MICPSCGMSELVHGPKAFEFTYKGFTTTFPPMVLDYCPSCAEGILSMEQAGIYQNHIKDFKSQVDGV